VANEKEKAPGGFLLPALVSPVTELPLRYCYFVLKYAVITEPSIAVILTT
jgi:hypothetical protein